LSHSSEGGGGARGFSWGWGVCRGIKGLREGVVGYSVIGVGDGFSIISLQACEYFFVFSLNLVNFYFLLIYINYY
jgi:hypothetical protein